MTLYDYGELKKKLVETANLAEFQDYFLSNFVEKGRFMSLGRGLSRARSEFLVHAIGEAYYKLSGATVIDFKHQLIELPEFRLIHGSISLNGTYGSVLYLEEIAMGVIVIVDNPATGAVKYIRFAAHRPTSSKPN